ncbi:MAG: type II toxin-antitoxin system RelE family toxin [Candidatus Hodarchaeales archaeon]
MENTPEFQVYLLQTASKELKKLAKDTQTQIDNQITKLVDPYQVRCKKLKGSENTYRLRVGKFRVVFKIYDNERVVVIIRIARRKKVYR